MTRTKMYYRQRAEDMLKKRLEQAWTLDRLAAHYRISRERVRQVLWHTMRRHSELACRSGLRISEEKRNQ